MEASDRPNEWVEAHARTVDQAVDAGLRELGLDSVDKAIIEVLREPTRGFLGIGGQDAIVKVAPKPAPKRRRRRRGKKKKDDASGAGSNDRPQKQRADGERRREKQKPQRQRSGSPRPSGEQKTVEKEAPAKVVPDINEQAEVAREFVTGLLDALGLDGTVETRIEDDTLYVDVIGAQTEPLVGTKGSVMQALHELIRTVMQRRTHGAPRLRLDVAGYGARRREALVIYAGKLAERVTAEGGEVMLEPMHAADRKVIHDAVLEIDGVRSYSEGEDPQRSVIIAADPATADVPADPEPAPADHDEPGDTPPADDEDAGDREDPGEDEDLAAADDENTV